MAIPVARSVDTEELIYYPEGDGKPMAESDIHIDQIIAVRTALQHFFRDRPDVYVSGNIFLYYSEGEPTAVVSPDLLVVKGVPKGQRRSYKIWEEGKGPDVIIEVTSQSTRSEDNFSKYNLYERVLRVPEYFQFDPTGDYLSPRLRGYRLTRGKYQRIRETRGRLHSVELGLDLVDEDGQLRLYNPLTGERLMTPEELDEARAQAEAEIARLRAELESLRKKGA